MNRRQFCAQAGLTAAAIALSNWGCQAQANRNAMPNYTPTGVRLLGSTPRQDGFYFPAEDAVHECVAITAVEQATIR
ncbi:MAG: hypothetical protein F6J87_27800, partial [Spirulina sp. SIO3F2]|nr:hypothetical protein [Spirulina sp. SIO3F2]